MALPTFAPNWQSVERMQNAEKLETLLPDSDDAAGGPSSQRER
jgi:hypothetical protein